MIKQAVILAAGLGQRLRPLTSNCPKPMLNVGGKPLLSYHLESLAKNNITNVVIHVSYLAEQIMDYVQDGSKWGLQVSYACSNILLGTGGGIKLSLSMLTYPLEPFVCLNADVFTEFDFAEFHNIAKFIDGINCFGTLVLVDNPSENSKGDYDVRFTKDSYGVIDKESICQKNHSHTFSGFAVYHPRPIAATKLTGEFAITEIINTNLDKYAASIYSGLWYDIGSKSKYQLINEKLGAIE